jgi:hypothetical protein
MKNIQHAVFLLLGGCLLLSSCTKEEEEIDYITFEELELDTGKGYWNGENNSGEGFRSGNAWFPTYWDDTWGPYWEGFAYTNHTAKNTPGTENQFSSYAGSGDGGSARYGVFYSGFYGTDTMSFSRPEAVDRISVSNTAYAAFSMQDGDVFTKKFGGENGLDEDWFSVIIEGIGTDGHQTGSVQVYLADFREPGTEKDYISNAWTIVPLDNLGTVQKLVFSFASSDTSYGSVNVPTYVCIDNIVGTLK